MILNADDINEFIKLYKEEFGEDLSFADAKAIAEALLTLLLMLTEQTNESEDVEE